MKSSKNFIFENYNSGFVVSVMLRAKDGEEDSVAKLLAGLVGPTMAEPGVELFLPYRSQEDPRDFFIFELYVDEKGWQLHQNAEHFKEAIAELAPKLDKRERIPFIPFIPLSLPPKTEP